MAPGKGRRETKEKKNGSLRSKAADRKGNRTSAIKKAKDKVVPKKKLKEQTSRQIEAVNDTFTSVRYQLVQGKGSSGNSTNESNAGTALANEKLGKETSLIEHSTLNEVTQEEVSETADNIASL